MGVFNRIVATILSIVLVAGSALGIVYLLGLLGRSPALTGLVAGWTRSLQALNAGQVQALLLGVFALAFVIFVLEVRPWRARYITIRDDELGRTQVMRADVERYLMQRLYKDMQREAVTPDSLGLQVHGEKFEVATGLAIPSAADRQAVRAQVEEDIKDNLSSIGLDEELERISARISRVKRIA